jgi:hypothetical protein
VAEITKSELSRLSDIVKRRGIEAVHYFHTDHFEPWHREAPLDKLARAVDCFAAKSRASTYGRRLSLFYKTNFTHLLDTNDTHSGFRPPGDQIVFLFNATAAQRRMTETMRELVAQSEHDIHVHIHHEHWTTNTGSDTPTQRWLRDHSDAQLDARRFELFVDSSLRQIEEETGVTLSHWGFIHGVWALNGSDPTVCNISRELEILHRHGCIGDFSFPAGRSNCDPALPIPFTCRPVDAIRAYDKPVSEPRPITPGGGAMSPDRMLIWNSATKHEALSIDCKRERDISRLTYPARIVERWLSGAPVFDGKGFIKTHAHSMMQDYWSDLDAGMFPHRLPQVLAIFALLERVLAEADVELRFSTVTEVMDELRAIDSGEESGAAAEKAAPSPIAISDSRGSEGPLVSDWQKTVAGLNAELLGIMKPWAASPTATGVGTYYQTRLDRDRMFDDYELALVDYVRDRFDRSTRFFEIGSGWGQLSVLLAAAGFQVTAYEGDGARHEAARHLKSSLMARHRDAMLRFTLVRGFFPDDLAIKTLLGEGPTVAVAGNVVHSYVVEHQERILRCIGQFDEAVIDLARLGRNRSVGESIELLSGMTRHWFEAVAPVNVNVHTALWHLRSRQVATV